MGKQCIKSIGVVFLAALLAVGWLWRAGESARGESLATVSVGEQLARAEGRLDNMLGNFNHFFQETRGSLLVAVEHGGFGEYFALAGPGPNGESGGSFGFTPEQERVRKELEGWVLSLHRRFPIGETCLVDAKGQEHMRVVGGTVEKHEDFSDKEGDSPFFKVSIQAKPGEVVTSQPYMSPDSYFWVMAFTTPVVLPSGGKPAFYHFEIPLSVFHTILVQKEFGYFSNQKEEEKASLPQGQRYLLVDGQGLILADSDRKIQFELKAERHPDKTPDLPDYLPPEKITDYAPPAKSILTDPSFPPILERMTAGETGMVQARLEGREVIAAFAPVGHEKWSLLHISALPEPAAKEKDGLNGLLTALGILLMGLAAAWILARKDGA